MPILVSGLLLSIYPVLASAANGRRSEAMQKAVRQEGGRVWIEGLPTLGYSTGKGITFVGSLEAALAVTDRPYAYSNLMGWSGLAFRMRRFEGDSGQMGSTSDVVGEFPEEFQAIEKATGWHIEMISAPNYKEPFSTKALPPRIVATIDAGVPALSYSPEVWDVGVIYGCENNGESFLFRDYMGKDSLIPAEKLAPFLLLIEDRGDPLPGRQALLEGLRIAVHNWKRGPAYNTYNIGHYHYGADGFRKWEEQTRIQADDPNSGGIRFAFPFTIWSLQNSRVYAAVFLRDGLRLVGPDSRSVLEEAAALYDEETSLLESVAQGEKTPKEFLEFLAKAAQLESRAIALIAKVLQSEATASEAGSAQE